jgi:hypothetical protein
MTWGACGSRIIISDTTFQVILGVASDPRTDPKT